MTELENKAIERIKDARRYASQFDRRLVLAYSGGKDSDVLLDLAIKSGVDFEVKHNHTTADAPDTVYYIREVFERLDKMGIKTIIDLPPMINIDGKQQRASMWNLIPRHKSPPTRIARYCCHYLKERNTDTDLHLLLGIRWAESRYRKKRGAVESLPKNIKNKIIYFDENDDSRKLTEICTMKATITTNPIIDWSDDDIWGYIKQNEIKMNPLYAKGYKRVGCIGCPMSKRNGTDMEKHFPKYKELYIRAFRRCIEARKRKGLDCSNWMFKDAETLYKWWTYKATSANELDLFDEETNKVKKCA